MRGFSTVTMQGGLFSLSIVGVSHVGFILGHLPATAHQDRTTTELLLFSGIVINSSNSIMTTIILNIKAGQNMFRNTAKRRVTLGINTSIEGLGVTTEEMMVTIREWRQTTWLRFGDKQLDDFCLHGLYCVPI